MEISSFGLQTNIKFDIRIQLNIKKYSFGWFEQLEG